MTQKEIAEDIRTAVQTLRQDGRNVILESLPLVAKGTCYSVEFADFLKKMVGHLPGDGPMRGALLPD